MKIRQVILAALCGVFLAQPAGAMAPKLKAETVLMANVLNYCMRPVAGGINPEVNAKEKSLDALQVPAGMDATGAFTMPGSAGWAMLLTFSGKPLCQILVQKVDAASFWAEAEKFFTDPAHGHNKRSEEKTGDGRTRTFASTDGKAILTISAHEKYAEGKPQAVFTYAAVKEIPPP